MNESRYWFLTGKYLSKSISSEEQTELDTFINANQSNKEQFDYHSKLWKSFGKNHKEIDFDSRNSWLELKSMINEKEKQSGKVRYLTLWRSVAAACILVLITVGIIYISSYKSGTLIITTSSGKQLFILPDSTHVWLNKNSQLSYNAEYGKDQREVQLKGEAYFEVRHNTAKPFIIESNKTYTRVLGTKFNVKSYDTDSTIIVSVVQGKVQFGSKKSKQQALILTKDCTGTFMKKTKGLQMAVSENPNALAWQTNKLVFMNSSLTYIIDQLENYYNIKIRLNSPETKNCSFSGTFNNQSLDEVFKILEFTLNLDFAKNSNLEYSVTGQACSN